jgi:hypothetical protein
MARSRIGAWHYWNSVYNALQPMTRIIDRGLQRQVHDLLQVCCRWLECGYLSSTGPGFYKGAHFLAVAAYPEFKDFILSCISASSNPSMLATEVLRDMFGCSHDLASTSCFVRPLLSLGADPSAKGVSRGEMMRFPRAPDSNRVYAFGSAAGRLW